jgi:hypothetical protein
MAETIEAIDPITFTDDEQKLIRKMALLTSTGAKNVTGTKWIHDLCMATLKSRATAILITQHERDWDTSNRVNKGEMLETKVQYLARMVNSELESIIKNIICK